MLEEVRDKLKTEINTLEYELRVTLPREIKKALEHGDLRENSEYKSALERQEFVRARLGQLQKRLSDLSTLDVSRLPHDRAAYGSVLEVENIDSGEKTTYRLVTAEESDAERGWISVSSPIGRGLVGHEEGDKVTVQTPGGVRRWSILSLRTIHDQ